MKIYKDEPLEKSELNFHYDDLMNDMKSRLRSSRGESANNILDDFSKLRKKK
jgi:hypothetical protein